MGDRGAAAGAEEDPRRDAVRWARRYGKNCLDSRGPGLRERAANIACGAPQGPAGKAQAGKGGAGMPAKTSATADESVSTAELGSTQATRILDSSSEPTATTNSGAAIELLSTEELKAARPRPARRRPVSAHAGTRAARSGPRVSLRGLAKLEERERKLSSVSFCDDRSMAADGRPRGRRPASAKGPGAGAGGAPRRRKARPASAPAVRKGGAASESWPSLPDVDAADNQTAIETTPSPEPRAAVRRSGGAPTRRGDEYAELHAALDRAHGGGWTERRLVCGAVLDALADTQPQLAGLLRRIGAEIPDREAPADDGRAFGSPKLKTRQAPSRTASGCQHCGSFVDKEQAEEMRQEVQRSRERMARAEAAAAHLQRQVALERSRVRELDERLQKLSAEKRPEQQQQQASAGPLRASYESEYSWDSSEEEEQEGEGNERTAPARVGLSGSLGRPLMGTAAVSLGVTDYAPPRIPAALPARAPPPPPAAATAAAAAGATRGAAAPQRVAM